jgi:Skp family chaperone for outer membrane proteins
VHTVKSFFLSAAVVTVLLVVYVTAGAQTPRTTSGPPPTIGIVDLEYVLKYHPRFQQQQTAFKTDAEAAQADMMREQEKVQREMEKLKGFKRGTPEFNKLDETITHMTADLQVKKAQLQKNFSERQARMMLAVYREMTDAVSVIAQQRGMTLVLKFNGEPVEPGNPQSIAREIGKPFAYHSREADITPAVLDEISGPQRGGGAANPNARAATRPAGVPPRN